MAAPAVRLLLRGMAAPAARLPASLRGLPSATAAVRTIRARARRSVVATVAAPEPPAAAPPPPPPPPPAFVGPVSDLELADLKATKAARRRQPEDDDDQSVRQRKVAADVRRCLVEVAMFDMTAVPVLHRTWTVNEVHMSRDLSVATVFWTATRPLSPDAEENLYLALLAFEGRIRYQLAKRLRLKRIPRLQLVRDTLDDAEAELEERFSRLEQESDRTAARRRRGRPPGRALDDLLTPEEQAAIDAIELPAEFRALVAEPAAPHDAGATRRAARRRTGSKPT